MPSLYPVYELIPPGLLEAVTLALSPIPILLLWLSSLMPTAAADFHGRLWVPTFLGRRKAGYCIPESSETPPNESNVCCI